MIGAVDIGGTKIAVAMVDAAGKILSRQEHRSGKDLDQQTGLALIISMLGETSRQAGGEMEGIGVGCTGPIDPMPGSLGWIEFLPDWEGCPLAAELQKAFGVDVFLENDADAAALGELAWGAGRGAKRFIYVTISTGIGVGMVFDGKLYRGVDGAHPELGHHVIDPTGPKCFCGARGCWESLAGGLALARSAGLHSAELVCQAASQGNDAARGGGKKEAYYLGLGFANLVTCFVPDVIAIGGGVMKSRDLFWDTIERTVRENCGLVPYDKTHLVPAQLGNNTGLVGAAQVWLKRSQEYA